MIEENKHNIKDGNEDGNTCCSEDIEIKEKQSKFRIFITMLVIISVAAFFTGICLLGVFRDRQWISLAIALPGIGLLIIISVTVRIVKFIRFLKHPKQALDSVKEVIDATKDLGAHYKSNYKAASAKHKTMILLIFGSFAVIILLMVAGVVIANYIPQYKITGFVFMGISFGGMLLWVLSLVIISKRS